MRKVKSYKLFIESLKEDFDSKLSEDNKELKGDVLDLIEASIKTDSKEALREFIESYLTGDSKIEGFINDADIYEFYLKYSDSIDSILDKIDYFVRVPKDSNIFGVYQYIIESTKEAMIEILKQIMTDCFNVTYEKEEQKEEVKESIFNIFKKKMMANIVAVDSPVRDKWNRKVVFVYAMVSDIKALLIGEIRNINALDVDFVPRVVKKSDPKSNEKIYVWEEIHKFRNLDNLELTKVKNKMTQTINDSKGNMITKEDEVSRIVKMKINW